MARMRSSKHATRRLRLRTSFRVNGALAIVQDSMVIAPRSVTSVGRSGRCRRLAAWCRLEAKVSGHLASKRLLHEAGREVREQPSLPRSWSGDETEA